MGESKWKRVARFRLRNEMRKGRYWKEEKERICRCCGKETEMWEYQVYA